MGVVLKDYSMNNNINNGNNDKLHKLIINKNNDQIVFDWLIESFNKYLLSAYYVLDMVLGTEDRVGNR